MLKTSPRLEHKFHDLTVDILHYPLLKCVKSPSVSAVLTWLPEFCSKDLLLILVFSSPSGALLISFVFFCADAGIKQVCICQWLVPTCSSSGVRKYTLSP